MSIGQFTVPGSLVVLQLLSIRRPKKAEADWYAFAWKLSGVIILNTDFNEPFDGIVYGTLASLGFATTLMSNGLETALNLAMLCLKVQ